VEWYETKFKEIREQAQSAIKKAQSMYKRKGTFSPYEKGDKVWLEAKNLRMMHPMTTLRPLRYGPFEITDVISDTTYRLQLPSQWKIQNAFHADLLMPYKQTEAQGKNFPRQIPDIVEGQEEWVVSKVLDSQRKGRKKHLQYLLAWEGFPDADNTWEFEEDVFAPDLIKEFHEKNSTAIRTMRISQDNDMQSHLSAEDTPHQSRSPSPENLPAHILYQPYSGGSNSPSSFGGFIFTPEYSSDGWEPLHLAPISVDALAAGFQGLSLSTMQPALPSQQDTTMLEALGSPEAHPVRPRGADHGGSEGRSLLVILRLLMPPGLTAEELESQERMSMMGSSVEEGSEAGEIRPVNEDGVEYIDLTLLPHAGDLQAGNHLGPPWQLGGCYNLGTSRTNP